MPGSFFFLNLFPGASPFKKYYFLNFSREEEEEEEDNGRSQEGIEKKTKLGRLRAFSDQPSRHPMLII